LISIKELSPLKEYDEELNKCMMCGNCRSVCPVFQVKNEETMVARGRLRLIKALLYKEIDLSPLLIEKIYSCLSCGVCLRSCPGAVDACKIIIKTREIISKKEKIPKDIENIRDKILNFGNPFGELRKDRVFKSNINERKGVKSLFYLGCSHAYISSKVAKIIKILLEFLNYPFILLGEKEECCGEPLRRIGDIDSFKEQIRKNEDILSDLDIKEIFTSCPGCYKNLKENFSSKYKIYHISQIFYNLRNTLKFKSFPYKIIYFDGCELARYIKLFKPPREILRLIPEIILLEFDNSYEDALCCGGPLLSYNLDLAFQIAKKRVSEALEKKAEYLITSCPTCCINLRGASNKVSKSIRILEITQFLKEVILC
jgi:Fe-S oxidoreductase